MNCKEFEMTVSELAGEQLVEASKYKLALAHKTNCARCAARLANERSLTKALQVTASAETEQASAHTKAALLKAFAERTVPSPASRSLSAIETAPITRSANVKPDAPADEIQPAPVNHIVHIFPARKVSRWTWVAAAAVLIALLTITAIGLLQPRKNELPKEAKDKPQQSDQPKPEEKPQNETVKGPDQPRQVPPEAVVEPPTLKPQRKPAPRNEQQAAVKPPRTVHRDNEVTSDYIPLSYVSEATAMESGHVVRMMVARSTLISMGLPMNAERDKEMVKADVVVGDDGLARAIRFVYSESQNKNK
jgi:hypothetical protein